MKEPQASKHARAARPRITISGDEISEEPLLLALDSVKEENEHILAELMTEPGYKQN
jgi:hypothetical protein